VSDLISIHATASSKKPIGTAPQALTDSAAWSDREKYFWLVVAFAGVIALYVVHAHYASSVIDGVRWYWLDDDQMVSMRYARNLAEGYGLVWNPGERVEGYTNFGWTLLMAAVHLLPLPDRLMPLGMSAVSALICLVVVFLASQLFARLQPRWPSLAFPVLLLCFLGCVDVMFWATLGFETILVTALHLAVVLRAIRNSPPEARLFVPLALIPIVRSDGMHIWLGDAALVFWLAQDRRRTCLLLLLSLLPFAAHLGFRLAYYGEALPNTYYLKLEGLEDRWSRGFGYVLGFGKRYFVVLLLAVGTAAILWRSDRRARSLLTSLAPPLIYSTIVGGDDFNPFRFFAHVMPELLVWAALGAARLVAQPVARVAWLLLLVAFVVPLSTNPLETIVGPGNNGDPFDQIIVAVQLRKNASPDATVAVIPAGIVPYFSRLKAIDLLGKTDPHIAHLTPRAGAALGHGKVDPNYSFAEQPDYFVSCRPLRLAQSIRRPVPANSPDYVRTLLSSRPFQENWAPNPLPDRYLLQHTAVYVRSDSAELSKMQTWQGVVLPK